MRQVLVLGAGKSAGYLIHQLLQDAARNWFVTVGDIHQETAREQVGNHPRGTAIEFDVNDTSHRETQIAKADVVVNMLAPAFQGIIAVDCIHFGKSMVSVSYEDQTVRDLGPDAHRKGVVLLTELGLDPGIDHMSTMALVQRVRADGGIVRFFCSYGSGVPAVGEESNPFRYVITWNPRNVVMAGESAHSTWKRAASRSSRTTRSFTTPGRSTSPVSDSWRPIRTATRSPTWRPSSSITSTPWCAEPCAGRAGAKPGPRS